MKLNERRDDTTEPDARAPQEERERAPRNYYDDDGTGYEVYDPAKDEDDAGADDKEASS
jgi:hypothetical protein